MAGIWRDRISQLRPRFSLLNFILAIAILSLALVVFRQGQQLGPLKDENQRLNEERGTLVVEDRQRVHAIRVPSRFAGNSATFRVFIPEGADYVAIVEVNGVPKSGFPTFNRQHAKGCILGQTGKNAFAQLPPGEHQVSLSVERRDDGNPFVEFATNAPGLWLDMSVQVPKGVWPQVTPEQYTVFGSDSVGGRTVTVAAGEPLVLLRKRILATSRSARFVSFTTPEPDRLLDGMMLWIEPAE